MKHIVSFRTWFVLSAALAVSALARGADAKENWTHYCVRCHGADGTGATKMGRKLHIKNLTLGKIQTRLTDDRIREAILKGNRTDDGEEQMPSFKDKLTDAERNDLVGYIRSLAKSE